MEWLQTLAAFAAGLAVRLGIPLAVTAFLVWLLRKLDARWQAEADRLPFDRPVPVYPVTGVPPTQATCWQVKGCPPEQRQDCPAFNQPGVPCWQVFRTDGGPLRDTCLECSVFLAAPRITAEPVIETLAGRLPVAGEGLRDGANGPRPASRIRAQSRHGTDELRSEVS